MIDGHLVRLRAIKRDDLALITDWRNSQEVKKTLFNQDTVTLTQQDHWFENVIQADDRRAFVIETLEQRPLGLIQLFDIDWSNRNADWGFYVGELEYRMRGHGAEAEYLLLRYAFEQLDLHRVYCQTFAFNTKVISMHRRFGFVDEGLLRQHIYRDGRYEDVVVSGLVKSEFQTVQGQMESFFRRLGERDEGTG